MINRAKDQGQGRETCGQEGCCPSIGTTAWTTRLGLPRPPFSLSTSTAAKIPIPGLCSLLLRRLVLLDGQSAWPLQAPA